MKKLGILSIFLCLMLLAFSIGYADRNGDLELTSAVNPTIIKPISGSTSGSVSFTITNYDALADMTVDLTSGILLSGTNNLGTPTINQVTVPMGGFMPVSFDVNNIYPTTTAGTYTATISAEDIANPDNNATLSYSVIVEERDLSITVSSGLNSNGDFFISSPDNNEESESFTISNNGNVDLTNVEITISGETDAFTKGSKSITFKIDDVSANLNEQYPLASTLSAGTTQNVNIKANIPNNMDVDTYEGNITIETSEDEIYSFPILVRVEPEICEDGRVSDSNSVEFNDGNLQISIDEPDDGDDFNQGDEIKVEVTIDNYDNNNMDVIVEVILYDVDDDNQITSVKSDEKEIEDGEEEDFNLELTIPYDDELDEDNSYLLYVKVYEDGDEDQNCEYEGIEMEFKRESHEVIVDSFTINPSVVNPGQLVSFVVDVLNVGEKDEEDVYMKIYNSELGLSEETIKFDLDKYDDNNNDETKTISFTIPSTATAKDYAIEAIVYFDDGDESSSVFGTLTVSGSSNGPVVFGDSSLSLPQTSVSATTGKVFAIPFTVSNIGSSSVTYTIEVTPEGGWADSVTETITVEAGGSNTGYAYLTPSSTSTGSHTATVTLSQDGNELGSNIVSVNVAADTGATGATTYQPAGALSGITGSTLFWVIGNVVLVVLVILILFLIFRKR